MAKHRHALESISTSTLSTGGGSTKAARSSNSLAEKKLSSRRKLKAEKSDRRSRVLQSMHDGLGLRPSVSFVVKDQIFETLRYEDYSAQEIKDTWYSHHDMEKTLNRCQEVIEKEPGSHCLRGLEKWMPARMETTRWYRQDSYSAVLKEQANQRREGINSVKRIAQVYRDATRKSLDEAVKLAKEDCTFAEKYLKREKKEEKRRSRSVSRSSRSVSRHASSSSMKRSSSSHRRRRSSSRSRSTSRTISSSSKGREREKRRSSGTEAPPLSSSSHFNNNTSSRHRNEKKESRGRSIGRSRSGFSSGSGVSKSSSGNRSRRSAYSEDSSVLSYSSSDASSDNGSFAEEAGSTSRTSGGWDNMIGKKVACSGKEKKPVNQPWQKMILTAVDSREKELDFSRCQRQMAK